MKIWQAIIQLVRFRPKLYLLCFVLEGLRYLLLLVPGLILRAFFDTLTGDAQGHTAIWWLIALLFANALVKIVVTVGAVAAEFTGFYELSALLRKNLLDVIMDRPGAQWLPFARGDLLSRLGGDARLLAEYIRFSFLVIGMAIGAIGSAALMISIDPLLALVALVPMLIAGIVVNLISAQIEALRRAMRAADGQISAFLGEMFTSAQAIQVAVAEQSMIAHFRQLNRARRTAALRDRLLDDVIMTSFMDNMKYLSIGVILLLVGRSMRSGSFTVGDFSLFVYLLPRVSDFTFWFGRNLSLYKQTKVSLDRMLEMMQDAPPGLLVKHGALDQADAPPLPAPNTSAPPLVCLEAVGLTYRYPDSGRGIANVALTLRPGMLTVITGRIGAGKTTLLRVLLGLLPRDAGEICWNGTRVADPAAFFVPTRSAYTPQAPQLFTDSLKNNILLGLPEDAAALAQAIRLTVMAQDVESLEHGLDTLIGPRGTKLSGGQAQRTAVARMLVRAAELLVFDDVSSALDVETEQQLWQRIFDERAVACLVVSHRRAVLQRADHILVLKDGLVEAEGTLEALLQTCAEMRLIWHGQRGEPAESLMPLKG
jgi:ATP-binding cassette, subfamily B, bacterial